MENIKVESVEDLEVFKRSHRLTIKVYKITERFPKSELFGLVSQMRRAAASIATNLMEGSHRLNRAEYRQFVGIAKGSAGELKYHFLLAKDLGYLSEKEYLTLRGEVDEISRMLSGLVKSLSR
ncbi:MAG: four helix bundle protein [Deltaproteobacteria bacterium]|nr:four helix bundle protein [Deltaproteobacteria bacterium]